jgi:hypothetical protein
MKIVSSTKCEPLSYDNCIFIMEMEKVPTKDFSIGRKMIEIKTATEPTGPITLLSNFLKSLSCVECNKWLYAVANQGLKMLTGIGKKSATN